MQSLPTLDTPRLRLRHPRADDEPALFRLFGDPEATRYWSHEPFTRPEQAAEYRARIDAGCRDDALYQWVSTERETDQTIGTVTLSSVDRAHRRAEVGYMLDRARWGQGLAAEAVRAVLAYAFDTLGLHRIEADIHPDNAASERLLARLGFQREGYLKERWFTYGEWSDSRIFGLLARDFPRA